jgi:hypothetical protein
MDIFFQLLFDRANLSGKGLKVQRWESIKIRVMGIEGAVLIPDSQSCSRFLKLIKVTP